MKPVMLARMLGWLSLALGATELALPTFLSRQLGLAGGKNLVRVFGAREIGAGLMVLAKPDHAFGPSSRIVGDALDIAVLAQALGRANPRRGAARIALGLVLGVTALDILCASALAKASAARQGTARRTRSAPSERLTTG